MAKCGNDAGMTIFRNSRGAIRAAAMEDWPNLSGRTAAMIYCRTEIAFYDAVSKTNFKRQRFWQTTAIIFGAIGTIAAAVTIPTDWVPWVQGFGWVRAVPVALATMASTFLASFSYQSESVRQGVTANALRSELALFVTAAEPYGAGEAADVSQLMIAFRSITAAEHGQWSEDVHRRVAAAKG